jgi:CRP/FNR family transcriptional regulator, anaerobic regulatory protein
MELVFGRRSGILDRLIFGQMESRYPFLKDLTRAQAELFATQTINRRFAPGDILFEEGFTCNNIFFVLKGSVRILKMSEDGREVTLYRIREGDLCLMTAYCIMTETDFPAVAQVEEPTEVVALPASVFRQLATEIPELQNYVFANVLDRLKDVVQVVENITFTSMRERLARFLAELTVQRSSSALKITHEELALEIGSAREVVSRTLKELEGEGILRLSRGQVQVLSAGRLKEIGLCD